MITTTVSSSGIADRLIDRLPPHSIEAEQGMLGCIMLSPRDVLDELSDRILPDLFYDLRHQTIYDAVFELYEQQYPIDIVTVSNFLKAKNALDSVGGNYYLMGLQDVTPSAINASYYLEILLERYAQRQVIRTGAEMASEGYNEDNKPLDLLDRASGSISEISMRFCGAKECDMKSLVISTLNRIEEYHRNGGIQTGISTGFSDLDRLSRGLKGGEFWVIAARPSIGKTSLAMNIVEHVALELKIPVGVFSFEMTSAQLVERMIFSRSRIHARNAYDGFLSERDIPNITGAGTKLLNSPIYIDDTSGLNILQIRSRARRWKKKYDVRLLVLDYLQLVGTVALARNETRDQQVGRVSSGLKNLAKELDVPIIAVSQLNREIEKEKGKKTARKPRLSDLRESGNIEQDADLVAFLYSIEHDEEDDGKDCESLNLLIAKQRNGPKGSVPLMFLKPYFRFESAAKVDAADCSML